MEEERIDQPETTPEVTPEEETQDGEAAVKESEAETHSVKDVLGSTLGKQFTTDEDALAAVEGLKKLVGDQKIAEDRKKAKELEKLQADPNYAQLRSELETIKLTQKHPGASEYVDEIRAIADAKGISYNEAFETSKFGALVAAQKQEEQATQEKIAAVPKTDRGVSTASDEEIAVAQKKFDEGDPGALIRMRLPNVFNDLQN